MTGITSITRDWGFNPGIVRIASTDTLATVAGSNYLTAQLANIEAVNSGPFQFIVGDLVAVAAADGSEFFRFSGNNFTTLVQLPGGNGSVVLPVTSGDFAVFDGSLGSIYDLGYLPSNAAKTNVVMATGAVTANHIATYTDTAGTVGQNAATAINSGNIQAGVSGTAGALISYPGTATEGDLQLAAVSNSSGNFNTVISNASSVGQTQTVSIPDGGTATSNFIISNSASGQSIATGNFTVTAGNITATAGNLVAGSSGHAGIVQSFPATSAKGSLELVAVANTGNTATIISNDAMAQGSTVNIPDPGNAVGQFLVGATATPFVSGNFPVNSGTAGLMIDSGISAATIATTATVSLTAANITGMYATPVSILAAPGAGKIIIIDSIQWDYAYSTAQYTAGGLITAQYGSTAHAGGVVCTLGIAAATFNGLAANGQLYDVATSFGGANTAVENTAIYMSNATQAFASGSGTVTLYIRYRVVTPA
jgi:hypothetical protein